MGAEGLVVVAGPVQMMQQTRWQVVTTQVNQASSL